ncbi:MAG: hypothetical protein H0U49_08295 [Parachlamydiaceae bacterium]|nr:hypothetical protein [Parachlamydiaceae bacterium]
MNNIVPKNHSSEFAEIHSFKKFSADNNRTEEIKPLSGKLEHIKPSIDVRIHNSKKLIRAKRENVRSSVSDTSITSNTLSDSKFPLTNRRWSLNGTSLDLKSSRKKEAITLGMISTLEQEKEELLSHSPILTRKRPGSSSEINLANNDKIEIVWNRLLSLSKIIEKVEDNHAIILGKHQNLCIKKITDAKFTSREICVKELLANIKFLALNVLNDIGGNGENLSLDQMIFYLERANWSSSIIKEKLNEELKLTKVVLINNEAFSAMLVQQLFQGEIEVDNITPLDKITLNDLSLIFARLTGNPLVMLQKVLTLLEKNRTQNWALIDESWKRSPKNEDITVLLIEFCKNCLQSNIGLDFYPDPEINKVLSLIIEYAPRMKKSLIDAYKQTSERAYRKKQITELYGKETVKITKKLKEELVIKSNENSIIEPLNTRQIYQAIKLSNINVLNEYEQIKIAEWHTIIKTGQWHPELACLYAKSIIKKTASEFCKVPLDELVSGKLERLDICPQYNLLVDSINSLAYVVANDILICKSKKMHDITAFKQTKNEHEKVLFKESKREIETAINERINVITFYLDVIAECLNYQDFASAFSLYTGLCLEPINSLKLTWKALPKDVQAQFDLASNLFNQTENSKCLKFKMNSCLGDYFMQPPYLCGKNSLGYESMEDKHENGMIDTFKFRGIARNVVAPFQKLQNRLSKASPLQTNELFDRKFETMEYYYMLNCELLSEMSKECEPHYG